MSEPNVPECVKERFTGKVLPALPCRIDNGHDNDTTRLVVYIMSEKGELLVAASQNISEYIKQLRSKDNEQT